MSPKGAQSSRIRDSNKARAQHALTRKAGKKPARPVILIVCEGRKTEPMYFGTLRRQLGLPSRQIRVRSCKGQTDPLQVVLLAHREQHNAESSATQASYDEIWCVFDVEQPEQSPHLPSAIERAASHRYQLAISNPWFE
ncbi:MAG: RloB domain-containing protein [Planctomycetes bacterium]|nr:RloB domain-containing protein [Planctomycetota bacterium]NOG55860.1 RloB domain-containing protein [Planctomycetota bacterium]